MNTQRMTAVLRMVTFTIGCTAAIFANAQSGMELPLEEVGVVRAVDPTRSMITVEKRTLQLTTATKISADDPSFRYSGVSKAWLGHQVAMETDVAPNGTITVVKIHIFRTTD